MTQPPGPPPDPWNWSADPPAGSPVQDDQPPSDQPQPQSAPSGAAAPEPPAPEPPAPEPPGDDLDKTTIFDRVPGSSGSDPSAQGGGGFSPPSQDPPDVGATQILGQAPAYGQPPSYGQDPSFGTADFGQSSAGQPGYGQPGFGQPGQPGYGGGGGFPPAGPPPGGGVGPSGGSNNKLIAAIVAGVVVVALAVGGYFAFGRSDGTKTASDNKSTSASISSTAPSFPSTSESSSSGDDTSSSDSGSPSPSDSPSSEDTTTSSSTSPAQAQLASIIERYHHAIAANDIKTFCSLVDPIDMAALLKRKGIPTCARTTFAGAPAAEKAALAVFAADASKIIVGNTSALLFRTGYTPASAQKYVGTVIVRRARTSAPWKVRISG